MRSLRPVRSRSLELGLAEVNGVLAIDVFAHSCLAGDGGRAEDTMLADANSTKVKNARTPRNLVAHVLCPHWMKVLLLFGGCVMLYK